MLTGVIQDTGLATALGFTPAPGGALYIGTTGLVSQTDPQTQSGAEFSQRIGTALSQNAIQINMSAAVTITD